MRSRPGRGAQVLSSMAQDAVQYSPGLSRRCGWVSVVIGRATVRACVRGLGTLYRPVAGGLIIALAFAPWLVVYFHYCCASSVPTVPPVCMFLRL